MRYGAAALMLGALTFGAPALAQTEGAGQTELRLQQLEDQVRTLTGQIETQNHQIDVLNQQIEKMKADTDLRLNDLEGHGGGGLPAAGAAAAQQQDSAVQYSSAAPPPPQQSYAPGPAYNPPAYNNQQPQSDSAYGPPTPLVPGAQLGPGAPPRSLGTIPAGPLPSADPDQQTDADQPSTPQSQYQAAYALIGQGQFGAAEQAFRAFLSQYPRDPLASSASYWVGHSYYARGDFQNAAVAFAEGYKKYPKGIKAPDTLLDLGKTLAKLDQVQGACATFAQFDKQFGNGVSSAIKRQELAEKSRLRCG